MKKLTVLFTLTLFFAIALFPTAPASAHAAGLQGANSESAISNLLVVSKPIGVGVKWPIVIGPVGSINLPCPPLPYPPSPQSKGTYESYCTGISGVPICLFGSEPALTGGIGPLLKG